MKQKDREKYAPAQRVRLRGGVFITLALSPQHLSVRGDGHDLPGDELAAVFQGGGSGTFQTAAAGHLHAHDGYTLVRSSPSSFL